MNGVLLQAGRVGGRAGSARATAVLTVGLTVGLFVGLGAWFVVHGVVPNVLPKNFGVVEPGVLYRSGELTPAAMRRVVDRYGIRTVIDLRGFTPADRESLPEGSPWRDPSAAAHGDDDADDRFAQLVADSLGVRRVNPEHGLGLYGDAGGDWRNYAEALAVIEDAANWPVLVHCAAGAQRTGCLVVLYRTRAQAALARVSGTDGGANWTRERALAEAERFGWEPAKDRRLIDMIDRHADEIVRDAEGAR